MVMNPTAIRTALTTAMLNSGDPMVLSDPHQPDCPLIVVNQAFADLTGYDPLYVTGRNCRFLQGPKTDPSAPRRIRSCLDAGQGCIEWIVNYRYDGTEFWNLLFISPVHAEDGSLLFFFGNQLDITMGLPSWLVDVQLGRAHVVPALEREFHALLEEVTVADRVQSLTRIVAAGHRLAEISTNLAPGTLEEFKRRDRNRR
jgi:PAS domain S-box-containing protein